jgi:gliding motility-associated-like protein
MKKILSQVTLTYYGKILFGFFIFFRIASINSQIAVTPGGTPAQLINELIGPGITTSNPSINCHTAAYGIWTGNLQAGGAQLSNGGIILTTGSATGAVGPNNTGSAGTSNPAAFDFSDPHLTTQPGAGNPPPNRDNCIFQFDMTPVCNNIVVSFVFGSEEYPEFAPPNSSSFNDGFGIFIQGPNPQGGTYNFFNVARLPNNQLVSINNVNPATNANFYNNNNNGQVMQYDGYTNGLTANLSVVPCSTYRVKMAIADAGDKIYDSGLFLGKFSFACAAPVLTITAPAPICQGEQITLTANTTLVGGSYLWSNGQTTQSIVVAPTTTTTYSCSYTLTNCNSASTSTTVTVNPNVTTTHNQIPPICQFSTAPTLPASSNNTPAIQGTWSPATIDTNTPGTTVYNFTANPGQCGTNATMSITVNPQILPTFNPIGPLCQFSTPPSLPTGSTNAPSITGTWSPTSISTNTPGPQTLTFTPAANFCASTATMNIQIVDQITPTFNQVGPLCQFDNFVNLPTTSTNSPGITGAWTPAVVNTDTPGTYTFNFAPNNPNQCAIPTSMTILINPQIISTFTQISPTCQNGITPILPTTSLNNVVGTWSPPTIDLNSPGTITHTFTPDGGVCTLGGTMDVTIIPIVPPTITSNLTQGCTPLNVLFSSTSTTGSNLRWFINGNQVSTLSSFNFLFSNEDCYNISLISENQGCIEAISLDSMICTQNVPIASFNANPLIFNNNPQTVNFFNNSIGGTEFWWDFGDGQNSFDFSPSHLYTNINSSKMVTLTATTTFGCTNVTSVIIRYQDNAVFYIPNAFTPDEDQFNQTWGPVFTSGFDPYNFDLYIFNRWGELIWESHDAKARWDGTYGKGAAKAPTGLYLYKIAYKPLETDEKVVVTGHINLMR